MQELFAATMASVEVNEDSTSVALGDGEEYLILSRESGREEDWGVHIEYRDQVNSGYDCIDTCACINGKLEVTLRPNVQVGSIPKTFSVGLRISESQMEQVESVLPRLLRARSRALGE